MYRHWHLGCPPTKYWVSIQSSFNKPTLCIQLLLAFSGSLLNMNEEPRRTRHLKCESSRKDRKTHKEEKWDSRNKGSHTRNSHENSWDDGERKCQEEDPAASLGSGQGQLEGKRLNILKGPTLPGGLLVTNKMELINTKENRRFYWKAVIITALCGSAVADSLQS